MSLLAEREWAREAKDVDRAIAIPDEDGAAAKALGPFYTTRSLTRPWGVTKQAINQRVERGTLLALPGLDGTIVDPAFQFMHPNHPQPTGMLFSLTVVISTVGAARAEPTMIAALLRADRDTGRGTVDAMSELARASSSLRHPREWTASSWRGAGFAGMQHQPRFTTDPMVHATGWFGPSGVPDPPPPSRLMDDDEWNRAWGPKSSRWSFPSPRPPPADTQECLGTAQLVCGRTIAVIVGGDGMSAARRLGDVAAEQWGLVTTAQACALGVSAQGVARLAKQGSLERMTHGVYRVSGAPPDPADELRAAWLTLDPSRRATERIREAAPAVVSHRSAAGLHALGDLDADLHEFTTSGRKQSRRPGIKLHRGHLGAGEWTVVDGMPVTTVARTIADLAATWVDGGHLASVVRDALTVQQVSDQVLSRALAPHAQRYGAPAGDGEALLTRFIQESGVSVPLGRAVELSGVGNLAASAAQLLASSPGMVRLQEQMAAIAQAIAPAVTSPGMERSMSQIRAMAAKQLAESGASKAIQDPAVFANLAEMSGVTEQIRQFVATPEFRRFVEQQYKEPR